jgi:hypothetical protein
MESASRPPSVALENLAKAMNSCERNNLVLKCEHGIIFSEEGIILPIRDRWVVRMLKRLDK